MTQQCWRLRNSSPILVPSYKKEKPQCNQTGKHIANSIKKISCLQVEINQWPNNFILKKLVVWSQYLTESTPINVETGISIWFARTLQQLRSSCPWLQLKSLINTWCYHFFRIRMHTWEQKKVLYMVFSK